MEVQVANGAWRHGSILSIRVGETRRQAPLQTDTRIAFAATRGEVDHMQVDVFARVGTTRLTLMPEQEIYNLNIDGEGFAGLALRINQQLARSQSFGQNADAASTIAPATDDGMTEATSIQPRPPQAQPPSRPRSAGSSMAEERIQRVRQDATEYMERFELRGVLQEMFQQVIKDRPEDPFLYMQAFLREGPAKRFADKLPNPPDAASPGFAVPADQCSSITPTGKQANMASVEADAEEENRRAERELMLVREREAQRAEIHFLSHKIKELEAELEKQSSFNANVASQAAAEVPALQRKLTEQSANHQAELQSHQNRIERQQTHIDGQQTYIAALERRMKDAEAIAAGRSTDAAGSSSKRYGRVTPGDEAAGAMEMPEDKADVNRTGVQTGSTAHTQSFSTGMPDSLQFSSGNAVRGLPPPSSASLDAEAAGIASHYAGVPPYSSGSMQNWASTSGALSTNAGTEVNTHMLSQLLASTYAAPVPPGTYFEMREDNNDDLLPPNGKRQTDPAILVDIVECADKTTNGTFAWIGTCNNRPLYRLLAPEPRYLYFAEVDPAWAGWWVADKMGSEGYVEWFREPADAKLPVYCRKGELGSRVVEAELTREIAQKLGKVSSQAEKTTIRSKLTEVFGAHFTKLEGSQRGLMSKTSPVVGVAHALEAQQRAIQLLHSQLGAETQRREAAEAHASTMEEAFETLQLRIQAKLPSSAATAMGQRFGGADELLSARGTESISLSVS